MLNESPSNAPLNSLRIYLHPRVIGMLFLGFSAGLPLLLVFGTLSFWLREAGVDRASIGFFSWVGLAYAVKWAWSPLVDRLAIPGVTKSMGRRRSWLLLSQLVLMIALVGMAMTDPAENLTLMAGFALLVAFASATQDISLDAYRIEAVDEDMQGAMSASYMMGYRLAMILASAGALAIAAWFDTDESTYQHLPWQVAYLCMAACMSVGVITTLIINEPKNFMPEDKEWGNLNSTLPSGLARFSNWLLNAVVSPFLDFLKRYGLYAILILLLISTYRISDIVLGIMANPFYVDMGYSKSEVASIAKFFGVVMTIIGAIAGGGLVYCFGVLPILFLGAVLAAGSNLLFAVLAGLEPDLVWLAAVISFDNFSAGIATAAFVAYMSSLTNVAYSATQYALFSSVMLLLPKFLAGFSGVVVENIGYTQFFVGTALLGLPILVIIFTVIKFAPDKGTCD